MFEASEGQYGLKKDIEEPVLNASEYYNVEISLRVLAKNKLV